MKERPILYSTPMAIAKRQGRKTQTRRIVKGTPLTFLNDGFTPEYVAMPENGFSPYGYKGDVLWGRETWATIGNDYVYKAAGFFERYDAWEKDTLSCIQRIERWGPSIFMPKAAAQIWERVISIRVERLQDISEVDCVAEGIELIGARPNGIDQGWKCYTDNESMYFSPKSSYESLWESINGPCSWPANPWVWVIETKILSTTGRPDNL